MRVVLPLTLVLAACTDYTIASQPKDTAVLEDTGAGVVDTAVEDSDTGADTAAEDTADPQIDETGADTATDTGSSTDTSGGGEIDTGGLPDGGTDTSTEPPDPPPVGDCDTTDDRIYLIDKDTADLYLFDPGTLSMDALGTLDCDMYGQPASMGVSRDGHAYVRYSDQTVYDVALDTMRCTSTSYSERTTRFGAFGMGYATSSAGTWRDQLFIANGRTLATLDTGTWRVTNVGTMPSQSELTGNAAGELWAFLPLETPAEVRQIDPTTGRTVTTLNVRGFPDPSNIDTFAFAAWGGELYAFVREYGMGSSTAVYRVDASGSLTRVVAALGINVVGAGVSTCAPTTSR